MGQSVEFRGIKNVLDGFDIHSENADAPYYSVWCGRDLRYGFYEDDATAGRAYLERVLSILEQSQTSAIYTLKFHDTLNNRKKIDSNSPVLSSFSFRVYDTFGPANGPSNYQQYYPQQGNNPVLDLLQKMDQRLSALEEGGAVGNTPAMSNEELLISVLESPVAQSVIGIIQDYLPEPRRGRRNMNNQYNNQDRAGMAGINTGVDLDPRILQAIDRLQARDPDFVKHITLLAEVAESSPLVYRQAIKKLKALFD